MKKLYLTLLAFCIISIASASTVFQGYLITKSGDRLTGYFTNIVYTGYYSQVVFINDFGTAYEIQPELIKAFVFRKENDFLVYESKRLGGNWVFLKVLYKGDGLNLYRSPENRTRFIVAGRKVETKEYKAEEYYVQKPGSRLKRLRKLNYRKRLRKLMKERAPELAKKIGSKGYKFADLPTIIREYNDICERTRFKL